MLPDQFDRLSMKEFYQLLDGYEVRIKERDSKQAYFTTWLLMARCGKDFDFVHVYKGMVETIHPTQTPDEQLKQDQAELKKTFNL